MSINQRKLAGVRKKLKRLLFASPWIEEMIPSEVECRIARNFFHMYLPDEVMMKV